MNIPARSKANQASDPRWWKEFRPLLLPVGLTATAALLPVIPGAGDWPATLAFFSFFCGIGLLAAIPYGTEFQQRTLPLLLSQPLKRSSIWILKLQVLVLVGIILTLTSWQIQRLIGERLPLTFTLDLMNWQIQKIPGRPSPLHFTLGINFLFAAFCSVGFWTIQLRSKAAGILVGLATQLCVFFLLDYLVERIYGIGVSSGTFEQMGIFFWVSLLYSATWLWLGWQYWRMQLPVLLAGVGVYGLVACFAQQSLTYSAEGGLSGQEAMLFATFMLTTLCSGCFWTLLARSTIGGTAFNLVSQFLLLVCLASTLRKFNGMDLSFQDTRIVAAFQVAGLFYSALMLWLGKRKFEQLELRDTTTEAGVWLSQRVARGCGEPHSWLRCHPRGLLANLIRKEVRLQKPLFAIAILFCVCWVGTLAVFLPVAQSQETCGALLNLLTVVYVPLAVVLAGCVSLGEEKALELTTWHLTLPMSARNQWLVKLGVSASACALFGLALPWVLIAITPERAHAELTNLISNASRGQIPFGFTILPVAAAVFSLSFWSVTLLGNTVRAVLVTVLGVVTICVGFPFIVRIGENFGGLQTNLLSLLFEIFGLSADIFTDADWSWLLLWGCVLSTIAAALTQSAIQFRRATVCGKTVFKYSAVLAGVVFLSAFWCADLAASLSNLTSRSLAQTDLHVLNNIIPKL